MKHIINFVLGDPNWEGHGLTTMHNMVSNYSAEEITKAYKETTKKLGFDFVKEVCVNYCDYVISPEKTFKLVELGLLEPTHLKDDGSYEFDYAEDEYLEIFENIIKYTLPDFKWEYKELEGELLTVLHGAGYGLYNL